MCVRDFEIEVDVVFARGKGDYAVDAVFLGAGDEFGDF